MNTNINFIYTILILTLTIYSVNTQCCLKFNGTLCITCPDNMHLYRNNCIFNILNCKTYSNGFDCSQCNTGFKLQNSACNEIPKVQAKPSTTSLTNSSQNSINNSTKNSTSPLTTSNTTSNATSNTTRNITSNATSNTNTTTNSTIQIKDYQQFTIQLPLSSTSTNDRLQRASVVDQILRSTYTEIKQAVVIKANDRVYSNGTKVIQLLYKVTNKNKTQTTYQGLMIADLQTFIFKEVSFKKVQPNTTVTDNKNPSSQQNKLTNSSNNQSTNSSNNQSITNSLNSSTQSQNNSSNLSSNPSSNIVTNSLNNSNNLSNNSTNNLTLPQKKNQTNITGNINTQSNSSTPINNGSQSNSSSSNSNSTQTSQGSVTSNTTSSTPVSNSSNSSISLPLSKLQQEYKSIKFIQLSDMDALMDINFMIGLNQINSKLSDLQGIMPSQIFAQNGYNSSNITIIHFIVNFQVNQSNSNPIIQEVKLKINSTNSSAIIDSVTKKNIISNNTSSTNSTNSTPSNSSNSPNTAKVPQKTDNQTDDKISQKSSYTQISGNPQQSDIFFLIFLDNLGKGLQNKLAETGQKSGQNEIIFAGKFDSKDSFYYWVETKVTCSNQTKRTYKVTGSQNKMTYQVKISQVQLVNDKTPQIQNISSNNSTYQQISNSTSLNTNNTQSVNNSSTTSSISTSPSKQNVTKNTNSSSSVPTIMPVVTPIATPTPSSTPTPTTQTSSNITATSTSTIITPISTPTQPSISANSNSNSTSTSIPTPNASVASNVTSSSSTPVQATPSTPTIPPVTTPTEKASPYLSQTYKDVNQTIADKAVGLDQIDSSTISKDDGVLKVVDTLLSSRPGKQAKKLYKAYIKNFGIKAEYKIYFIDITTNVPKIDIYEGYATFDLLRKRVFVISFAPLAI